MGVEPTGERTDDPPTVLKTAKPTGAPTPPRAMWLYFAIHTPACQAID